MLPFLNAILAVFAICVLGLTLGIALDWRWPR